MSAPHTVQWTFQATLETSSEACRAAEAWARGVILEEAPVLHLALILEELFLNTVKYGYGESGGGPVQISLTYRQGALDLVYADQAPPFDPTAAVETPDPDIASDRLGGVGLRLIRSLASNIAYRRDNGWNVISLCIGG